MGWNADAHDDIVPCEFGTFVRYADYLTLAQQRDAAVRARAECVAREQRWLARLAACEGDAARLDWLEATKEFRIRAPRKWSPFWWVHVENEYHDGPGRTLRDAIDATMARTTLATAQGASAAVATPNDGHARTVRRTPPQDAATTRGEGC
jgi:hypothetical protein